MNCSSCGESALGLVNGVPFCHRPACFDWKSERIRVAAMRLDTAVDGWKIMGKSFLPASQK